MEDLPQPKASPGMLEMLEAMRRASGEPEKPSFLAKIFAPEQTAGRKIVTRHVCPPIPVRGNDWCAYYEAEEEAGNYGWGGTEAEAISDFMANCAEDHNERLTPPKPKP